METKINLTQIRWRCRRGMLELDVFLVPYFDNCFKGLSQEAKSDFIDLLESSDPVLLEWLMGRNKPEEEKFAKSIRAIQGFKRSTFTD